MKRIPGNQLSAIDQQTVLRSYNHRYTGDHKPDWSYKSRPDGSPYPVQFASDADWLANTLFVVTDSGRLDERVTHCQSSPTWPDNPELRK